MADVAAPRWNRLEHDERRAQLVAAARRLFCERSYAAVSAEEIARSAGVARGLLHHYFGTKRNLYLEVVRDMVRRPVDPVAPPGPGRPLEVVVGESVDRWLDVVARFRETWFASIAAEGFGRDPELEAIVSEGRAATVELIITTFGLEGSPNGAELRSALRAYSGFAEVASREWLLDGSLTRAQTRALLAATLLCLVQDVVADVADAAG